MTAKQKEVFDTATKLLAEHFDSHVLVVAAETDDSKGDAVTCDYHGGYPCSVGLVEIAKMRIWETHMKIDPPEEDRGF